MKPVLHSKRINKTRDFFNPTCPNAQQQSEFLLLEGGDWTRNMFRRSYVMPNVYYATEA
jgi:hypothetical protein